MISPPVTRTAYRTIYSLAPDIRSITRDVIYRYTTDFICHYAFMTLHLSLSRRVSETCIEPRTDGT